MNELQKYFEHGVDGLMDGAVKGVMSRFATAVENAMFLVFVMTCGLRRLKCLFTPDKMTDEEKVTPVFSVEAIPAMTDAEVCGAFLALQPLELAEFIMKVRAADGPVAIRFAALLKQMDAGERAMSEANRAELARQAQEEADKAREAAKEAEAKRPRRDDEAMKYIAQAPQGRFQVAADLDAIVANDEVFDWVNRRQIPVGDAMVLGLCLIIDKRTAERLAEKLRRPKDKNRPLAYSIAATRDFLIQREKENEAARTRKVEEERAAEERESAERGDFLAKVRDAFAIALSIPAKELVRNQLKAECGGERWKLDIVRMEAELREQEIFVACRQQLREKFPHSSKFPELDAFIKEMEAQFIGRVSEESWSDNVVKGAERHINIIRRHRQWLEDNPRGVVQPKPDGNIIDFPDKWESSVGHQRPKFGPGSGIGGQKREKTAEERMIHRGRQLANGDCRYWSEKFKKPVEKFTDDDFKKVVEIFGDVKGDRKAAKKQSGKKN